LRLLLDTNILGRIRHPRGNPEAAMWFQQTATAAAENGDELIIPEITDYELRRKLIHLADYRESSDAGISLQRLDFLIGLLTYLPLSTMVMRRAASLWARARGHGQSTASEEALDGDVILAAQALEAEAVVVSENTKHLSRLVKTFHWRELLITDA
jgi:predicted nucleic acid-binding protein